MIAQDPTITKAAMQGSVSRYQTTDRKNSGLSRSEQLEGLAWSIGFKVAGAVAVIVTAPAKLLASLGAH